MPEYLVALIYILLLSTVFFYIVNRPVSALIGRESFIRRRNLWLGLTISEFLVHNFWIWSVLAIIQIYIARKKETNNTALFFFVLFAVPAGFVEIPAWGIINYFFDISYQRILALLILLPAYFQLKRQHDYLAFGRTTVDKLLASYLILTVLLYLRETSITDTLRQAFYLYLDIYLPYIVISRSLRKLQDFKDTLLSLVIAISLLALIAVVESTKHWLVFKPVIDIMEIKAAMTGYLGRDGMLRVSASVSHPLALGYLMVVGIGMYLFVKNYLHNTKLSKMGMLLLVLGLIAPLSRGPWIGCGILIFVFIASGQNPMPRLFSLILAALAALLFVSILPGGERVINLLPFIGTTEVDNIEYREQLLTNSILVIQRYPWFGSVNYMDTPEMQALLENNNMIDIVNSYIGILLTQGFVGLFLFLGIFATVLLGVKRSMRNIVNRASDIYLLGRVLIATLLAALVIIFTTSSISIIPLVYYSLAGLSVAYIQMVLRESTNRESKENNKNAIRYGTR